MQRQRKRSQARSSDAIEFARGQRAAANEFAQDLWQLLRDRRCCGKKFRREFPIPPYTADFCCVDLKLIIEVDGEHHLSDEGRERDRKRDQYLQQLGYRVMRIPGYEVLNNAMSVRESIEAAIRARIAESKTPSPPTPLPRTSSGGEGSQKGAGP